jgi:predicted DNA-binding WGR domain protein
LLKKQREIESGWDSPTTNDAIDQAFADLDGRGIVALQNAGYTISDGWADVNEIASDRVEKRGARKPRGGTFYHGQDVERGVEGRGLQLAFGAYVEGPAHEQASIAIGREICEVLGEHGVKTVWPEKVSTRIEIPPFEWRKRRWTTRPSVDATRGGDTVERSRRLTCTTGGSNKFWEGHVSGSCLTVRFGRIGTTGRLQVKDFPKEADAVKELTALVREKLGKGYVDH